MATRLPPLNALRAFEAAARHLSFEKAGDEIFSLPLSPAHSDEDIGDVVAALRRVHASLTG